MHLGWSDFNLVYAALDILLGVVQLMFYETQVAWWSVYARC